MPGLIWYANMAIGLVLSGSFLLFAVWMLLDGAYLFGAGLLALGLLGLFLPHYVYRRLTARHRRTLRRLTSRLPFRGSRRDADREETR